LTFKWTLFVLPLIPNHDLTVSHLYIFRTYLSFSLPNPYYTTTSIKMSWQSYVDDQLLATKHVSKAALCGHDGNIWATSAGFNVTAEELKKIITNFGDISTLAQNGVNIAATKFMFLSANEQVVRAKKGTSGLHIMKCKQAVIVSMYEEPIVAEQCATVTEKLGEYLISVGY